jgi:methylated-DNA-[protein]-cysteine S-methyltransferase
MITMGPVSRQIDSPFGPVTIFAEGHEIIKLRFGRGGNDQSDLLDEATKQLAAYFAGDLKAFDLPLRFLTGLTGEVQRQMMAIPLGETRTYGEIGKAIGTPAQAIGQACGGNVIPILIPCHRVLGTHGLGGFSAPGGVETKVALLKHEGAASLLI